MDNRLVQNVADLNEEEVLAQIRKELAAGTDPGAILEACRKGMNLVGERYEKHEYFVADLMMVGMIFKEAMEILSPKLKGMATAAASKGTVVFGTVAGDIHDIGKNVVVSMLGAAGFDVHDLGVDVPVDKFVAEVKVTGAKVLGLSGLITVSYDGMKATIEALKAAGLRDKTKVMIGGGIVNESVRQYTGADAWGKDANEAVAICQRLMGGK